MGWKGLIPIIGVLVLSLTGIHAQCSDALTTQVEDIVRPLLGTFLSINGVTSNCDSTIKSMIDCANNVQPKLDELNAITDITGFCLVYAMEFFDDPDDVNLVIECKFADVQDACPDLVLDFAVNGSYGEWSAWTECTSSTESRTRSRECDNPSPANDGYDCSNLGEAMQTEDCNTETTTETEDMESHGTRQQMSVVLQAWLLTASLLIFGLNSQRLLYLS